MKNNNKNQMKYFGLALTFFIIMILFLIIAVVSYSKDWAIAFLMSIIIMSTFGVVGWWLFFYNLAEQDEEKRNNPAKQSFVDDKLFKEYCEKDAKITEDLLCYYKAPYCYKLYYYGKRGNRRELIKQSDCYYNNAHDIFKEGWPQAIIEDIYGNRGTFELDVLSKNEKVYQAYRWDNDDKKFVLFLTHN